MPIEPIPESHVPNSSPDISTQPLCHSTHLKHPLAWHKDYLLPPSANHSTPSQGSLIGTRYPLSHFISYSNLSSTHCTFLANISKHKESSSCDQVIISPH